MRPLARLDLDLAEAQLQYSTTTTWIRKEEAEQEPKDKAGWKTVTIMTYCGWTIINYHIRSSAVIPNGSSLYLLDGVGLPNNFYWLERARRAHERRRRDQKALLSAQKLRLGTFFWGLACPTMYIYITRQLHKSFVHAHLFFSAPSLARPEKQGEKNASSY